MTKDKNVYETKLELVPDPRSKHTPEDRKAQFDLAMKLYGMLGDMTFAVDRINGVRAALEERAGKLPAGDPLAARLRQASADADTLRKKIVATKEGGMITGEERLREYLTDLYDERHLLRGPALRDPGRAHRRRSGASSPTSSKEFDAWAGKELPGLNQALAAQGAAPIELLTREAWEKAGTEEGAASGAGPVERDGMRERD